ncbi:HEAT repeat protein [Bacteriovorax sp. DB6_IX]|nr:HEAT repeat protein [Bacteriovorax sp. DB6_IX]
MLLGKRLEIETLESLLIDEHLVFRWMALDLYIQTYNDKAFVPLLKFIQDERNLEYRGVLFQLMAKYANLKIQDLIFMLSHLPNEKLLEILLKVLETYPVQEVKDIILNEVRGRSSIRVISSAIQILSNFPDERFFYLLKIYYQSSSIELRVRIAKILKNLDDERGVEILKKLTCDTDFFVRNEACYSLVELKNSSGNHYLRDIFEDPGHPSHKIINNIYSLRAFEEVA